MSRSSTSRRSETRLREIEIRSPECSNEIETAEVVDFLESIFKGVRIAVKPTPFSKLRDSQLERVALYLASSRVKDISRPFAAVEPMYGEMEYEIRGLEGEARLGGIVYDGRRLEELFIDLLGTRNPLEKATIVMTDRLMSTYSSDDLRHHLRTVVLGFPSIMSIPGFVEAPAKPRSYYLIKQRLESSTGLAADPEVLKRHFKGMFLERGAPGMTEVAKGLALQAVVHHLTLNPFCPNRKCRLFNAHWQEELMTSQVGSPGLCANHSKLLRQLGRDPVLSW